MSEGSTEAKTTRVAADLVIEAVRKEERDRIVALLRALAVERSGSKAAGIINQAANRIERGKS